MPAFLCEKHVNIFICIIFHHFLSTIHLNDKILWNQKYRVLSHVEYNDCTLSDLTGYLTYLSCRTLASFILFNMYIFYSNHNCQTDKINYNDVQSYQKSMRVAIITKRKKQRKCKNGRFCTDRKTQTKMKLVAFLTTKGVGGSRLRIA